MVSLSKAVVVVVSDVSMCTGSAGPFWPITAGVELHTVLPDSKPGLPSNCAAEQPPVVPIVQVKLAEPEALVVSVAVTVLPPPEPQEVNLKLAIVVAQSPPLVPCSSVYQKVQLSVGSTVIEE